MTNKPEVKVGQVWRSKDKRDDRYVLIDSTARKDGAPAMWCLPCTASGKMMDHGRVARVKIVNLQTRFELIQDTETSEAS